MKAKSKNPAKASAKGVVAVATAPKDPVLAAALKKTAAIKHHKPPPAIAPLSKKLLKEDKAPPKPAKPVKVPAKVVKANAAKLKEGGRVAALTKKAVSNIAATVAAGLQTGTKAPEAEPGARKKNKPKPVPAPKASKAKPAKPPKAKVPDSERTSWGIFEFEPELRSELRKAGKVGVTAAEMRAIYFLGEASVRKVFEKIGVTRLKGGRYILKK